MRSEIRMMNPVRFPAHTGERIYMLPFERELPSEFSRWQPTVDAMLSGLDGEGPCYLMVDQSTVEVGKSHRRPGLHVDGNWIQPLRCHGTGPPGHKHIGRDYFQYAPETIVLAADVLGAMAYAGEFDAEIGPGGEVETDVSRMDFVPLTPGVAWAGNVTMLHESVPVEKTALRTLVRINAPGYAPAKGAEHEG